MTTGTGAYSRHLQFAELSDPLDSSEGVLSPSVQKRRAAENLGLLLQTATGSARVIRQMAVPATATDTATLTTAQVLNGVIQGTPTTAANYTLPLASAMDTALPDLAVGDAVEFTIINRAATATFDITVVTNTGWTLNGPVVIGAGASANGDGAEWTSGTFRARKTGTAAYTLYRV